MGLPVLALVTVPASVALRADFGIAVGVGKGVEVGSRADVDGPDEEPPQPASIASGSRSQSLLIGGRSPVEREPVPSRE
jgi:hypothetical protein